MLMRRLRGQAATLSHALAPRDKQLRSVSRGAACPLSNRLPLGYCSAGLELEAHGGGGGYCDGCGDAACVLRGAGA